MQEIEISWWFLSYLQDMTANPANLAAIFSLPWSALKKPSWKLNFLHIFAAPLSSMHEKCFQILERLFVAFHHSRNILCNYTSR